MAATILIIALGIFAIGVVAGIMWVLRIGVDREGPFLGVIGADNLTRGARRLTGLYVKNEEYVPNAREDMLV